MNKTVAAIVAIIVIAGAGGAIAVLSGNSDKTTPKNPNPTSNSTTPSTKTATTTQTNTQTSDTTSAAGTITYSGNGFSPSSLTLKAGDKLTVKNTSSHPLQFDSNPHPEHTEDPELNIGLVSPGSSQTITVTKTGSHGYHNHLSPGDTGTLIVE